MTRDQWRALFAIYYLNSEHRLERPFESVRIDSRGHYVYLEIRYPADYSVIRRGSNYDTYWVYIDPLGNAYNDSPSQYERFESSKEHRAKLESYSIIWSDQE